MVASEGKIHPPRDEFRCVALSGTDLEVVLKARGELMRAGGFPLVLFKVYHAAVPQNLKPCV